MALRIGDNRVPRSVAGCRAAYDAHPAGYAQVLDPTLAEVVERIAVLAAPRSGVRVLDLACGTGTIARAVARRAASVLNVVLRHTPTLADETQLRAHLATIGIGSDGTFNASTLTPEMRRRQALRRLFTPAANGIRDVTDRHTVHWCEGPRRCDVLIPGWLSSRCARNVRGLRWFDPAPRPAAIPTEDSPRLRP
jgi:hypothetical protein